jgi:hypothetical protein
MALRNGSRLPVSMRDVFPEGCHLVPDSIVEADADMSRGMWLDEGLGREPFGQGRVVKRSFLIARGGG